MNRMTTQEMVWDATLESWGHEHLLSFVQQLVLTDTDFNVPNKSLFDQKLSDHFNMGKNHWSCWLCMNS